LLFESRGERLIGSGGGESRQIIIKEADGVYDGSGPVAGMASVGAPTGGLLIRLSGGAASSSGSKGEEGASTARSEAERITIKASKM